MAEAGMNLFFRNSFEKVFYRGVTYFEFCENEDGKQILFWFNDGTGARHSLDCDDWYIMTEKCQMHTRQVVS